MFFKFGNNNFCGNGFEKDFLTLQTFRHECHPKPFQKFSPVLPSWISLHHDSYSSIFSTNFLGNLKFFNESSRSSNMNTYTSKNTAIKSRRVAICIFKLITEGRTRIDGLGGLVGTASDFYAEGSGFNPWAVRFLLLCIFLSTFIQITYIQNVCNHR